MKCHRINELSELLLQAWADNHDLNLVEFIKKLADEAGFKDELLKLPDDVLIYHLKMRNTKQTEMIPGLKKDYETDFKTALLKSRGIIKND